MIEQYGLISAVLGGFAFTFVGAILSANDNRKIIDSAFILGVVSATIFFICAFGWSLISNEYAKGVETVSSTTSAKHKLLSFMFIAGILTLSSCLGVSGWTRSRKIGMLTTIITFISAIIIVYLVKDYIT